jgi:hypothetical protein
LHGGGVLEPAEEAGGWGGRGAHGSFHYRWWADAGLKKQILRYAQDDITVVRGEMATYPIDQDTLPSVKRRMSGLICNRH